MTERGSGTSAGAGPGPGTGTSRTTGTGRITTGVSGRLRTVSLRRRVVIYSLAVLAIVLVMVSVLAELFVATGSRSDLNARLADRAELAAQLADRGTSPDDLVDQLASPSVRVRLVTPDGVVHGSRFLPDETGRPGPPDAAPPGGAASEGNRSRGANQPRAGRRPPGGPATGPTVRRTLPDGSRLTLLGDAGELTAVQRRLGRLLLFLGTGGLAVAIVALLVTMSVALRPLDTMTALARSIAGGDRGRRLAPTRTDTELGRTAAAFDDMLDALEGAERQAQESEERTRQFVADAAHELRTPIAGLRVAAEASLSTRADGEERDRLQLLLIREAARAGRLVDDLLALARIDAGLQLRRESVELVGLAEAEAERTRLLAPTMRVTVTGEPLTVDADPGRLTQVLANLLDNARRHTPRDGEITVAVDHPPGGQPRVRVSDTGPGVPAEDRTRIFDRLVRLDEARARDNGSAAGAGLGLSIARGIAQAHGGELRCVAGSVFELTLPGPS